MASECNLKSVIDETLRKQPQLFEVPDLMFVDDVPFAAHKFHIDGREVFLSMVVAWDNNFLKTMATLCNCTCIMEKYENLNHLSLYRMIGGEDRQFYTEKLRLMKSAILTYKFIDNIVVRCRNCIQNDQCDSLGYGLLWVEWRGQYERSLEFTLYFDRVLQYCFSNEKYQTLVYEIQRAKKKKKEHDAIVKSFLCAFDERI